MIEAWSIRGEYMESCNCEVLCPCLLGTRDERGSALAEPTDGHCDVPMIFQIHDGHYGEVQLQGIKVGVVIYTPGAMGLGDWTFGLYLDEEGTPEQREACEKIFSGQSGGAVGRFFGPLISHRLPDRGFLQARGRRYRAGQRGLVHRLQALLLGLPLWRARIRLRFRGDEEMYHVHRSDL